MNKQRFITTCALATLATLTFSTTGCGDVTDDDVLDDEVAATSEQAQQSTFKDPAHCETRAARHMTCEVPYADEGALNAALKNFAEVGACAHVGLTVATMAGESATIVLTPLAVAEGTIALASLTACSYYIAEIFEGCSTYVSAATPALCEAWCPWDGHRVIGSTCYCPSQYGACDAPTGTPTPPGTPGGTPTPGGYKTTCDNGVGVNQCASANGKLYKCVHPNGNANGVNGGYSDMWRQCNSGGCSYCSTTPPAGPAPAPTCDNGVYTGQCAYVGGYAYKCINPSGASSRSDGGYGAMWRKCASGTCC